MTVAPELNSDREKIVTLGILLKIDNGVYVCKFNIYTAILKQFTQHGFIYYIHFSTRDKSELCGAMVIIDDDNRSGDFTKQKG